MQILPRVRVCVCTEGRGGSSQSDASDWSWRSARLYSRAVKQEDAEDQSRCVRWQLSESRQWTSSQSLTPGVQITDRRHCLQRTEFQPQLTGAFLKKGPEVRRGMDRSRGYHRNCCWHSFREVWGVWKLPCDSVRYHADTYAEYVKLFVKSCNSNESLLPRLLCKVWISGFIACVTAYGSVIVLLKSCYFLHVLFSFLCPAVALQRICAQCVYQCGLFTVLLCRLTGATLRQFHCNPNSEAKAWTAFTERNLYSSALLHPEGQLVLSSRCYTALCTNVDYSGDCYEDRVEPQKTCL